MKKTMTYEQWTAAFKHALKKKLVHCVQMLVFTGIIVVLPFAMILHYIIVGY